MVSVEEFNRVVNMNISLMRIIEEDYRPLRVSVGQLRQEQEERGRLIDNLEEQVRVLREKAGVRRFY